MRTTRRAPFRPPGTVHVAGGHINISRPTQPIAKALAKVPADVSVNYVFGLTPDRAVLSINPRPRELLTRGSRGASRGFDVSDNAQGGKDVRLEGGPFDKAKWVDSSFRKLVKNQANLDKLEAAGYSLDEPRHFLVVNGKQDKEPTVFALSEDRNRPGLVAVCSEVTVLDMDDRPSGPISIRKPVIYLYPASKQLCTVEVNLDGRFVAQYPRPSGTAWEVVATPDGMLFDPKTERRYSYLFWEGTRSTDFHIDHAQAFCVKAADAEGFLEKACNRYGLNDREKTDFVSYWIAHLQRNEYSLIQFLDPRTYEKWAKLKVTPEPDATLRMFMVFQGSSGQVRTGNPELPTHRRGKFTVVEWGGANLDERR